MVHELQAEVQRHLEVKLHGAALPRTAERVLQVEVDLRAVEGAVALVELVIHAKLRQSRLQAVLRSLPVLIGAHGVVGAGGKLHMVLEAELLVHRVDKAHDAHDLVGELVGAHEQVRIVLVEAAHAEQAVQGAAHLVAVHRADLAGADGQVAIAARLGGVHEHAAGAVHRLDAILFIVDDGGVHVVLVMVPVARGHPQLLVHDHGRGDLDVAGLAMDLAPVVEQRVLEHHAVGQEEREARGLLAHHEQVHLAADLAVVALLGLFEVVQILVKLGLLEERRAVEALQLLAACVGTPIGACQLHELDGADFAGRRDVRAGAQIDEGAVTVDGDLLVGEVVDVLELEALVGEDLLRLLDGDHLADEGLVGLDDLLHLLLDGAEVVGGDVLGQQEVVEVAVIGCRAEGDLRAGEQLLHGLGHDMGAGMAQDMQRLGAFRRDDLDGGAIVDGGGQVDELAVDLTGKRGLRKARADGSRHVGDGCPGVQRFLRAVGQNDFHDTFLSSAGQVHTACASVLWDYRKIACNRTPC